MVKTSISGEVMAKEGLQLNTIFKVFLSCSSFWLMASICSKLSYKETWATTVLMASFIHIDPQSCGSTWEFSFLSSFSPSPQALNHFFFFFNLQLICQISVFLPPFLHSPSLTVLKLTYYKTIKNYPADKGKTTKV